MPSVNKRPPYKMGGPRGAVTFILLITSYTYYVTLKCQTGSWDVLEIPQLPTNLTALFDLRISTLLLLWLLLQCLLYSLPVGVSTEMGIEISGVGKLSYRTNALLVLFVNVLLLIGTLRFVIDVTLITGSLLQILTSFVVISFVFSWYLYIRGSTAVQNLRNTHGHTGNLIYDWFMGRELNPRYGVLDFKYVMFRSCIIGWILLNVCNIAEHVTRHHTIGPTLFLLNFVQLAYVVDYFWFEHGVIVSRDIVHEGLGYNILVQFMMIPFCFCIQTRYVLTQDVNLEWYRLLALSLLYGYGYYIYRASNTEKNDFRINPTNPKLAYLRTMPTARGTKLLISGWWGTCRHPNYLGDLIMSLSYALFTGMSHMLPYIGTIMLLILLLDREKQDSEDCRRKYGKDWDRYCSVVKYRIVPGLY